MTPTDRLRRMAARNPLRSGPNRRAVMGGFAAGAAAAALPGAARAQGGGLSLLTWDAYADPRLLEMWREKTGVPVRYEIHISDPTSVNRLRAGETDVWDFVNLNNPWAREILWPEGLITDLPRDRFEPLYAQMFEKFAMPYEWALSEDGEHLLGVVQRFETFDFCVNSDVIAPATAKDEGWDLFNNPDFADRYGILAYEDWNVMDICMGAGIHPFRPKTDADLAAFEETARRWIAGAKLITTDFVQLNLAMLNGEIDLYFTGGTYTASSARAEGATNIYAITPNSGPADGKGGINWIELNSAVANPSPQPPPRCDVRLPGMDHHARRRRDRGARQRQPSARQPDGAGRGAVALLGGRARRDPVGRVRRAHRQCRRVRHRAGLRPPLRHLRGGGA